MFIDTFDDYLEYGNSVIGDFFLNHPWLIIITNDLEMLGLKCRELVGKENYFLVQPTISLQTTRVYFRTEEDLNLFRLMYQHV